MEDIFQWCREGNAMQVRVWLDDTEHDMNQGYVNSPYMEISIYVIFIIEILYFIYINIYYI